jgi:hypothetical protein
MGLFDGIFGNSRKVQRKRQIRKEPSTPEEAKSKLMATLITKIGKDGVPGMDLSQLALVSILRDVSPDGDPMSMLAAVEAMSNPDMRSEYTRLYLENMASRAGSRRRGRRGDDDDEDEFGPLTSRLQEAIIENFLEDIEEQREKRKYGDQPTPSSGLDLVLANLTSPNGLLAKLAEGGLPLLPAIAQMQSSKQQQLAPPTPRMIQQPTVQEPVRQVSHPLTAPPPAELREEEGPAEEHVSMFSVGRAHSEPQVAGPQVTEPQPQEVAQQQAQEGGDMFLEMARSMIYLFDTSLPPAQAAAQAWERLNEQIRQTSGLKQFALGTAINGMMQLPSEALIGIIEPYTSYPDLAPTIESIKRNPEWLEQFMAELSAIWSQAAQAQQEEEGGGREE